MPFEYNGEIIFQVYDKKYVSFFNVESKSLTTKEDFFEEKKNEFLF
jgi:hypothetical protein